MIPTSVKHLVFDLGGVIINLSIQRTIDAFAALSGYAPEAIMQAYLREPIFFAYERGEITAEAFRNGLKQIFNLHHDDASLDKAWNAMILDLPAERLNMIKRLRKHFVVSLLSNTNSIHLDYVHRVALKGTSLDLYFDKAYYSHEVGLRKPDAAIYQHVLQDSGFAPHELLFLDDNVDNITGAQHVGIHTVLIKHPDEVMKIFNDFAQ